VAEPAEMIKVCYPTTLVVSSSTDLRLFEAQPSGTSLGAISLPTSRSGPAVSVHIRRRDAENAEALGWR